MKIATAAAALLLATPVFANSNYDHHNWIVARCLDTTGMHYTMMLNKTRDQALVGLGDEAGAAHPLDGTYRYDPKKRGVLITVPALNLRFFAADAGVMSSSYQQISPPGPVRPFGCNPWTKL